MKHHSNISFLVFFICFVSLCGGFSYKTYAYLSPVNAEKVTEFLSNNNSTCRYDEMKVIIDHSIVITNHEFYVISRKCDDKDNASLQFKALNEAHPLKV